MDKQLSSIEARLARLSRATEDIHPRPGFEERVLLAVQQSAVIDWRAGVWRVGRYGLILSVVAVALATVFAVQGAARADEMQAIAYGTVDSEW
jgi:hypothetical protein